MRLHDHCQPTGPSAVSNPPMRGRGRHLSLTAHAAMPFQDPFQQHRPNQQSTQHQRNVRNGSEIGPVRA